MRRDQLPNLLQIRLCYRSTLHDRCFLWHGQSMANENFGVQRKMQEW